MDKPAPADDEVLVNIHVGSVNAADWRLMRVELPCLIGTRQHPLFADICLFDFEDAINRFLQTSDTELPTLHPLTSHSIHKP